jgi:hypothetical protein
VGCLPNVDADLEVGGDGVADPLARAPRVASEGGKLTVRLGEHGLEARPRECGDRPRVGVE